MTEESVERQGRAS